MGLTADTRIPVTVLTGFLGSGKTTLLNALLRRPELADTAVIVNEIGAVDVDRDLLAGSADDVLLLDSGCLCCAMLNSFRETLASLYERRARGELAPFRRVIVETTGLADPAPILQTLLRDSVVGGLFELHRLVATVDALHGEAELAEHAECEAQVAMADRLVVTKTDLTGGVAPAALLEALQRLNPTAPVVSTVAGAVEPEVLIGPDVPAASVPATPGREAPGAASRAAAAAAEPAPDAPPYAIMPAAPHSASHGRFFAASVTARHDAAIVTESFVIERPVTWAGLAAWMDSVREFFGARMLRCKGILAVGDPGAPVVVQGVRTVFSRPEKLARWPGEDQSSRLVCISRGIEAGLVEASLALLHAEPGTFRPATIDELRGALRDARAASASPSPHSP